MCLIMGIPRSRVRVLLTRGVRIMWTTSSSAGDPGRESVAVFGVLRVDLLCRPGCGLLVGATDCGTDDHRRE